MIASGLTADGADPGMNGVTRYGRLPVGMNGKAKYVDRGGRRFVQRVAIWSPEIRYSVDEIAEAYGVNMTTVSRKLYGTKVRHPQPSPNDGFIAVLQAAQLYLEPLSSIEKGHRIVCPWVREHTDQEPSGTVYFEPSEHNEWRGGFKCHHGHCLRRNIVDLAHFVVRLLKEKNGGRK